MRESRKADAIKSTFRAVFKLVIQIQWATTTLKDYYRGLGTEFEESQAQRINSQIQIQIPSCK